MKKRKYTFNEIDQIPFTRLEQESLLSNWFLSYCLLVSESEKFIVRQLNNHMKQIKNPQLLADLKVCIFQETQHALSHARFSQRYLINRPFVAAFLAISEFVNFKVLETLLPAPLRLSVAAAIEQLNAEISYYGLSVIHRISREPSFQDLLGWHFVEEIEHRDCVFDLMKLERVSMIHIMLGALLTFFSFSFWITMGSIMTSFREPRLWFQLVSLFGPKGILTRLWKSTLRFLDKKYHPSKEIIPSAFSVWQEKVQALE